MKKNKKTTRKGILMIVCILIMTTLCGCKLVESGSLEVDNHVMNGQYEEKLSTVQLTTSITTTIKPTTTPNPTQKPTINPTPKPTTNPTPKPTIKPTPTPVPKTTVTIAAVGDNLIHTQIISSGKQANGTYNFDHLFTHIKSRIAGADLAVINQETILGGKKIGYSGYPRFNSPTEIGDAIIKAGFDVVLHATNHAMDKGEKGLQNTLDYWDKHPQITVLGVNETKSEANTVKVVTIKGIRIAMLNYTFSLNGLPLPKKRTYMVNLLDEDKIRKDVAKAKECSDFVIVFPHWGTEYSYQPSTSQKKYTLLFAELGVDLVIGAHPHVLEPVKWINGKDGHKMLVYYSLGNYISSQTEMPRMLGGMANVTIEKVGNKKATIKEASITPLVTHISKNSKNYTVYPLSEYTKKLADSHQLASKGVHLTALKNLAKQILGSWYIK